MNKFGFLRENKEKALKAGIDTETGLCRTGLDEYLNVIFPNINDWVHGKQIPKELCSGVITKRRPDYRSEKLKLIIEFDGLQHYTNPDVILSDKIGTELYQTLGYKVVRIPYFIQLTNKAVKTLFGVETKIELFNENIASLRSSNRNTPAYLCIAGIERMKNEFKLFPEQYKINKEALMKENNIFLTRVDLI